MFGFRQGQDRGMHRARCFDIAIVFSVFFGSAILSADGWGQAPRTPKIAFTSLRGGNDEIYVMDADGKNQRYLTPVGDPTMPPAAWSPDGKKIVFESSKSGGKLDIYVMNADGTNRRRLTKHLEHDRHAAWSPDSQSIIFYSERDGQSGEIYVMDANGNNQRNLTNHPAPDGFYARSSWFDPAFALSVSPVGKRIVSWGEVKAKQ